VDFRKHVAWYLKGFAIGSDARSALGQVSTLAELEERLGALELDQPYPLQTLGQPRGRTSSPRRPALPEGWLDDPENGAVPAGAELADSGG
jgi:hypothetical protein